MTTPAGRLFAPTQMAIYCVGLLGFAFYTRAFLSDFAESYRTTFTYWDVVLDLIGSGYVIFYWLVPIAVWGILRQLQGAARLDNIIRYATRTDWALAQGVRMLPGIALLVGVLIVVALVAASGFPFTWRWGPSSADDGVLLQLPELTRSLPLPLLSVVLHILALIGTLFILTVLIAAAATNLDRPRVTTVTAVALILWAIASFRMEGWLSDIFGVSTYALPWRAEDALPFGPGSGVMVLLVAGTLVYASSRWLELQRPRLSVVPTGTIAMVAGGATLLALASTVLDQEREPRWATLMLLQGVGTYGVSFLHYLAGVILVLLPAIQLNRRLVASLAERRYVEMIRLASPARWYARQFGSAAILCAGYGLAMAVWAIFLVTAHLRTPPDYGSLQLAGLWGLALSVQTLVIAVMLALGTVLSRRVEGGAYACVVALVLSWPLGELSRWSPVGQASMARFTDLAGSNPVLVQPLPLLVLFIWLAVLGTATLVLFNRTRGEIL
ncbi:hypothetical protein [Georgenia yuyongxinii]